MKCVLILLSLIACRFAEAQISVLPQLPPIGLTLKSQLWNLLAFNNTSSPVWVHFELTVNDAATNLPVFSATTSAISLAPGTELLQAYALAPIQYTMLDPAYAMMPSEEFMPVGSFVACFNVIEHRGDATSRVWEECEFIDVQPVAPPELLYPYNETAIETPLPIFNWLPPNPMTLFAAMTYDLNLVEVLPHQTENDAIQQNIPIYTVAGLTTPFLPYPSSATPLEIDKKYAWQVLVRNGQSVVTQTEVWWFNWSTFQTRDSIAPSIYPFAKMGKNDHQSYVVAVNLLKFDYVNETSDTTWNFKLSDITSSQIKQVHLDFDQIPLKRGQNFIAIDLRNTADFINKHIYTLEILNSRNEKWSLRFEYHREESEF